MLDIYSPNQFRSTPVQFVSTLDIPEFDLSEIDKLSKSIVDIDNKRVKTIEDNYNNLLDTQDDLTGLDGGTAYGFDLIKQVREDHNLTDDVFNFSMDQLKDPFHQRGVQTRLQGAMQDPRMREALNEGVAVKQAREDIRKLARKDSGLAMVAKNHLNKIVSDPNSQRTIFDFSIADYEKLDVKGVLKDEIEDFRKQNPNVEFIPRPGSPEGFIIFDKTLGEINPDDFLSQMLDKYEDNPVLLNNLAALQDLQKAPEDRTIEDRNAIMGELRDAINETSTAFGGSRVVDSVLKEDRIAIDNARRDNALTIENAKAEDRLELENQRAKNRLELEEVKADARVRVKTTQGAGTARPGVNNTVVAGGTKSDAKNTFEDSTNAVLDDVNSKGLNLENTADGVNLNSRLKKGDQVEVDETNNEIIVTDPTGNREDLVIPLSKLGTSDVAFDLLSKNPFISSNYPVGSEKWNYASQFITSPEIQDGFYRDYYVPNILDAGVNRIKGQGIDTGDYNENQLRYLVHHQGEAGARHFLETGEILPDIVSKAGSNRDVKKELTDALAKFEADGPFEQIKDRVESGGNYSAVTTLPNSSALGKHQVLFDTFFQPIKDYIDGNGGLQVSAADFVSEPQDLDLSGFNRKTDDGLVQTKEVGDNIVTNDPAILKKFQSKKRMTASKVNEGITEEGDKFRTDSKLDFGLGLFGVENAGEFISLSRDEFIEGAGLNTGPDSVPQRTEVDIKREDAIQMAQQQLGPNDSVLYENDDDAFGFQSLGNGLYEVYQNGQRVDVDREELINIIKEVYPPSVQKPKSLDDF